MSKKKQETSIYKMLIVSIITIVCFIVFFANSTFAWFTSTINSGSNTLVSSRYDLDVDITLDLVDIIATEDKYELEAGKTYKVVLTATESAETGFCLVKLTYADPLNAVTLYTEQIANDSSITFYLQTTENVTVEFIASWGSSIKHASPDISNNDIKII